MDNNLWQEFHGPNAAYILELYDQYLEDAESVDPAARAFFEAWQPPEEPVVTTDVAGPDLDKVMATVNLAQAIREYGHLGAQLDPLGSEPPDEPTLDPAAHGLTEADLAQLPASLVSGPVAEQAAHAQQAIAALRAVYSSHIGYDFDHLRQPEERDWLRQAVESGRFRPPHEPLNEVALLERLTQVESFENFLHRIFPGKTRFSIEGLDMLVPMLDEIVGGAVKHDIYALLLGMAHRGRLNVLAHVLNKPYAQILAEFKDPVKGQNLFVEEYLGWTGDVKYHMGASRAVDVENDEEVDLVISIAPNPSHLEAVNPVVEGMARAAGTTVDQRGEPHFNEKLTLPILIHGDTAFPGQGIVAETLNFSRLPGYQTGGTIHIIANNQLGYTTLPEASRSTLYASDLAKGFKIPIVHVNADDPISCIEVARLAFAYRVRFQRDFLIDLIGYRRYGHNEGDEPSFTQPRMYDRIRSHPTVRAIWAGQLIEQGQIEEGRPEALTQANMDQLQQTLESLEPEEDLAVEEPQQPPPGAAKSFKTNVEIDQLQALNQSLLKFPDDFNVHSKLKRFLQRRRAMLDKPDQATIDWATAEDLALGSILADGIAVRMTGQDVERGTFSQRHAVFHDAENGQRFVPLQELPQAKAAFEIHNSPLTENAAIGFEYGYNIQEPGRLVIWEAQYGDFINGAQVILDEFVTSGRAKWGQTPSLVLLLPHAYEGQGPDHSSGRLERFLQAAAETNMRIANCTTAAQYFHLLRRQAGLLETDPLPLVVMTPKSLLRHPQVASPLRDLAEGGWQPVIDDAEVEPDQVRRLILCSGKVYVDLITSNHRKDHPAIAIARLEQIYPCPIEALQNLLTNYPKLEEVVWLQEEPVNMGAWSFLQPILTRVIDGRWPLQYLGRPRSSSPSEGSLAWHQRSQSALIELAYKLKPTTETILILETS